MPTPLQRVVLLGGRPGIPTANLVLALHGRRGKLTALGVEAGVGDAVAQWTDFVNPTRYVEQATANNRPLSTASGLDFDGINDWFSFPAPITTGTTYTAYIVANGDAEVAAYGVLMSQAGAEGFFVRSATKKVTWYVSGDHLMTNAPVGVSLTSFITAAGDWNFYTNGAANGSGSGVAGGGSAFDNIGGEIITGTQFFTGQIYSILIYDGVAHDPATRASIERFLMSEFSITP